MTGLRTSFTLAPASPHRTGAAPAGRWYAPGWSMLPIAARRCRVRNPLNETVAELDAVQYAVLAACEGCRTLDEHFAAVRNKLGVRAEDAAAVGAWLRDFAAAGLLVAESDLVGRMGGPAEGSTTPIAGIVIRTCDRPLLLARVLQSAAALRERSGRRDRYIVLDDSRAAAHRAANRQAVAAEPALDAAYIDLSVASALEQELRRRVPDADGALSWLLAPAAEGESTYGRPLNFALLLTAGQRMLVLDDDALLAPRRAPGATTGFEVSSARDELFTFADRAALEAACAPLDIDPIAAHAECLGQPLPALWARCAAEFGRPEPLQLEAPDAARFAPGARVLFTQNHALGDPGSSLFPYHVLALPDASRAQLLRDPAWAQHAFATRIHWRGQHRTRLAVRRALTLTTLTGIDNRLLIPPTVRAHRNEDLLLGEMTQHAHPSCWFVDLPWGLPHWREPAKAWLGPTAAFAQEPVHFLMEYLGSRVPAITGAGPEGRLRTIGALLQDLAGASERHLQALLEHQAADTATRALFAINEQLDDPSLPGAWKDMLRPWLQSPALAIDPPRLRERLVSASQMRKLAWDYGAALVAWPALWNAARELAARARAASADQLFIRGEA